VDRDALARLVSSISRLLTPEQAAQAAHVAEVEVSTPAGWSGRGRWTVWARLGVGAAIRQAVAEGRRLDGQLVERVIFALVAQRALEPGSKLAGTGWVAERVVIEGCAGFTGAGRSRGTPPTHRTSCGTPAPCSCGNPALT